METWKIISTNKHYPLFPRIGQRAANSTGAFYKSYQSSKFLRPSTQAELTGKSVGEFSTIFARACLRDYVLSSKPSKTGSWRGENTHIFPNI